MVNEELHFPFLISFSYFWRATGFTQSPIRACWGIIFGGEKDGFFVLMGSNFLGIVPIAIGIAIKFEFIRAKKALFKPK